MRQSDILFPPSSIDSLFSDALNSSLSADLSAVQSPVNIILVCVCVCVPWWPLLELKHLTNDSVHCFFLLTL